MPLDLPHMLALGLKCGFGLGGALLGRCHLLGCAALILASAGEVALCGGGALVGVNHRASGDTQSAASRPAEHRLSTVDAAADSASQKSLVADPERNLHLLSRRLAAGRGGKLGAEGVAVCNQQIDPLQVRRSLRNAGFGDARVDAFEDALRRIAERGCSLRPRIRRRRCGAGLLESRCGDVADTLQCLWSGGADGRLLLDVVPVQVPRRHKFDSDGGWLVGECHCRVLLKIEAAAAGLSF